MTRATSSAMWIRRTVLAALPALFARPAPAQARGPQAPAPPVVLLLGDQAIAPWRPALLEAGCEPLGPLDPADLVDAMAFIRAAPTAPAVVLMGPAPLIDAQSGLKGVSLMVRLAEPPAPISGRAVLAAATALLTDDALSKAHAVMLASQDPAPPPSAAPTLTLFAEGQGEQLSLALKALAASRA